MHRPACEPDWKAVKPLALSLLAQSHDLRLAICFIRAAVSHRGIAGMCEGLAVIEGMLLRHWDHLHPQLDPDEDNDPTARINTLLALTDAGGMLRQVVMAPLANCVVHGSIRLRDIEIANGNMQQQAGEAFLDMTTIDAAFRGTPFVELTDTASALARCRELLQSIAEFLRERVVQGLDLTPLLRLVDRGSAEVGERLPQHPDWRSSEFEASDNEQPSPTIIPGELTDRDDVICLLDRICEYYSRAEPASPVPLLLQRARRLVNVGFLEIVADLSPKSLSEWKALVGQEG
jgi:type VI secretion system protein ImpA